MSGAGTPAWAAVGGASGSILRFSSGRRYSPVRNILPEHYSPWQERGAFGVRGALLAPREWPWPQWPPPNYTTGVTHPNVHLPPHRVQFRCMMFVLYAYCICFSGCQRCISPKADLRVIQPQFTLDRLYKHEGAAWKKRYELQSAIYSGDRVLANSEVC